MAEVCLKLVENSDNTEKQPTSGAGMFWRDFYLFQQLSKHMKQMAQKRRGKVWSLER